MAGKFVVSEGKNGQFYFVLKAGNGEVVANSEGYATPARKRGPRQFSVRLMAPQS